MWISLKSTFIFPKFLLNSRLAFHLLVGTLVVTILHFLHFNVPKTELTVSSLNGITSQPQVSQPRNLGAIFNISHSHLPHPICYQFLYFPPLLSFWDPCFPFSRLCSCFWHLLTSWLAMISLWPPSLQSFPHTAARDLIISLSTQNCRWLPIVTAQYLSI